MGMSERDRHRTYGILAILSVLALVGWAVFESLDETVTGAADDDDAFVDDQQAQEAVEETQESNMRQTQDTVDTSETY